MKTTGGVLRLLNTHVGDACVDPRTLRKTPRITHVKRVGRGSYVHFGLLKHLQLLLMHPSRSDVTSLSVQLHFDGVKITSGNMWPQQGRVVHPFISPPFLIGTYYGVESVSDVKGYLVELIGELKFAETGFEHPVSGTTVTLSVDSVCADIPARAFIKQMPGHTGFFSCDKCFAMGETVGNTRCFVDGFCTLRSHQWFTTLREEFSPFQDLNLDMSLVFPIDYMHAICLGVMKSLIALWYTGPSVRPKRLRDALDKELLASHQCTPCDFNSRCCKPFGKHGDQKATQYRLFLLYIGPVLLRDFLTEVQYRHFAKLHYVISAMCSPQRMSADSLRYCDQLLHNFVDQLAELYGAHTVSPNFHYLFHLAGDYRLYGQLDNFSCFPYESNMSKIGAAITSPTHPASQLYRRFFEKATLAYEMAESDILDDTKSEPINPPAGCDYFLFRECCISNAYPNNAVLIGGKPAFVQAFDEREVMVYFYHDGVPLYTRPTSSAEMGIVVVRDMYPVSSYFPISSIDCKCVAYRLSDHYVFLPILHTTRHTRLEQHSGGNGVSSL